MSFTVRIDPGALNHRATLEEAEAEAKRRVEAGAPSARVYGATGEVITTFTRGADGMATGQRSERWRYGDCPVCQGRLVLRVVEPAASAAGWSFIGCSNAPPCTHTQRIPEMPAP